MKTVFTTKNGKNGFLAHWGVLAIAFLLMTQMGFGATYYSGGNNAPNSTASWWTNTNGTGGHPANFTTAGDIFIIQNGHTMTASANWTVGLASATTTTSTVQINNGGTLAMAARTLTLASCNLTRNGNFTSTGTVTISGTGTTISIAGFTTTGTVSMTKTAGTATFTGNVSGGAFTLNGAGGTLNLGSGLTHTFSGTFTRTNGTLNLSSSTLNINGTTVGTGGTWTSGTSTVVYGRSGIQTIFGVNYYNLSLSGTSAKTFLAGTTSIGGNLTLSGTASATTVANMTIGGNLDVGSGTTFNIAGFTFAVTGTTTVGGSLVINGYNATRTFTGLVTVNLGGTWNNSSGSPVNFRGGITNSGTFTAGAGNHTFTNNNQALSGSINLSGISVTVTTVNLTNNGTLTLTGQLLGTGTMTNSSSGTLNIGGSCNTTITNIDNQGQLNISGTAYSNPTNLTNSGTITHTGSGGIGTAIANLTNTGVINLNGTSYITGLTNNAGGIVNFINASQTLGTFVNATSTSTLNFSAIASAATAITTLTATATGNTVNYSGSGAQTVKNTTYSNLTLSGSGIKTFAGVTTVNDNLSINTSAQAALGTGLIHTAGALYFNGALQAASIWGGTGAAATNINTTYFAAGTGLLVTSKRWTGATSTNWHIAGNWSPSGIPTASDDIYIPNVTNKPTISAAAVCNGVVIASGSSLTIAGTNTLAVSGGFANYGTFIPNNSTVTFNGTNQAIGGTSTPYFYNLTLSGSGTKTFTAANSTSANVLTVNSGVTLALDGTNSLTPASAGISGTVAVSNTASLVKGSGTITFNAGSTYNHARDGGTIPTAAWNITSNCSITGVTNNAPGGINQTFGNVIWNSTQANYVSFSPTGMNIAGNLQIDNTGATWDFAIESDITIGGNLIVNGGTYRVTYGSNRSHTINGNLVITGGTLNLNSNNGTSYTSNIYLKGNMTMSGGALTESGTGNGNITFNGTAVQTFNKTAGTISNTINFAVSSGAILDMGTSVLDGSNGTFSLNSGGGIITAHAQGLSTTAAIGSIQVTGTKTFSTGANYTYDGTVAQNTGNALPATVNNLTINNTSAVSAGVTFNNTGNTTSVSGILSLTKGRVTASGGISVTNTSTSAVVGGSTTSFVNGALKWSLPANLLSGYTYNYPVGTGTTYLPFSLVNPTTTGAATAQITATLANPGGTNGTGISAKSSTEYWALVTTGSYTSSGVSLTRQSAITPYNVVAGSTTLTGAYANRGGAFSTYGVSGSNTTTDRYFVFATSSTPSLNVSTGVLYGFSYPQGSGPSSEQSFVVSTNGATNDVTITPNNANFEISTESGGVFQTTALTIPQNTNATVYVRLKSGLSLGNYQSILNVVSSPLTAKTVNCYGSVSPAITAGGGGSYCEGSTINLTSTGGTNRYWTGPDTFYSLLQNPSITGATTAMSGTYTVTGSTTSGTNLVTNGNFTSGNTGFTSAYTYVADGAGNSELNPEGLYTITTIANNVHSNFNTQTDHTANSPASARLQMIINGATSAGVNVWSPSSTISVTPYTNYQFSYWLQTAVNGTDGAPSQLQLFVNSIAAGPTYQANPTSGVWTQFIYNWFSGASTTANLSLVNQQTAAGGNDFALDDIRFEQVYTSTASTDVTVVPTGTPASVGVTASENPVNSGTNVTFTATPTNGGTAPTYQWSVNGTPVSGATSSTYSYIPVNGDVVSCTMTSNSSCYTGGPVSASVTMTVNTVANYWLGNISTDWNNAANWTAGYVPGPGDNVTFATTANNGGNQAQRNLVLDQNRTVGILTNATSSPVRQLIIPVAKCLTVNQYISAPDNDVTRIYIQASTNGTQQNGSLIFNNSPASPVYASVEMYSKASYNLSNPVNSKYKWQYFGIPVESVVANPTFYQSYLRVWNEAGTTINNHWVSLTNTSVLEDFKGYEISQAAAKTYTISGKLVNSDQTITLPYTPTGLYPGQMVLANSYTAAIDITKLSFANGTEETVYLYNTGSYNDWVGNSGESTTGTAAGQYTAAPKATAGTGSIPGQIPSMQGFLVKGANSSSTITIPYSSVVRNTDRQRAPSQNNGTSVKSSKAYLSLSVSGSRYADQMWLISDSTCTRDFDNGWDGYKILGNVSAPQIFAIEDAGNFQVNSVNDLNGSVIGFLAGEDSDYELTFTRENLETIYPGLYLVDMVANKAIDIMATDTVRYSFSSAPTPEAVKRFKLISNPSFQPVSEGNITIFSNSGMIFIQNNSTTNGYINLFDMSGRLIKKVQMDKDGIITTINGLKKGYYVVNAYTNAEKNSKQVVVF